MCHAQGISLSDWLDRSFQAYPQKLVNVRVMDHSRRKNWTVCTALTDAITSAEQSMGETGRILVRASGTEPVLRVMVEAEQSDAVELWTRHLAAVAEQHLNVA